ncbi:MAG TPA: alpha/beta fold hydrolase [Solirubrobacteraceae bacterium]|nr:alpha/beta fold hydrolase [Solirubrobacteraceae bacterium]
MPTATDTRTVSSGDVRLCVQSAGHPDRPTLVLVHGYPDTQAVWAPVVERLAAQFHVVTYDVRGAGGSSAPRGRAAYHLDRLADDFDAVCRAVAPERAVHLVGHDWGGIQGWEFVTRPRFAGRVASFTSIAGPALGHALVATRAALRRRDLRSAVDRARRSWYIVPLCLPGGPTLMWKVALAGGRWRQWLTLVEGMTLDDGYPAPTVSADGWHGANLYRANIPHRFVRRNPLTPAHAPVQLIVPTRDRFISGSYYDAAARVAPGLRRHEVSGTHWLPRAQPAVIAARVAEFAHETEAAAPH